MQARTVRDMECEVYMVHNYGHSMHTESGCCARHVEHAAWGALAVGSIHSHTMSQQARDHNQVNVTMSQ